MPTELLRVKCRNNGALIITDQFIRVEHGTKQRTMSRSALVGIDNIVGVAAFLGIGGHRNLIFRSQGTDSILAEWIKPNEAKEVLSLLGY